MNSDESTDMVSQYMTVQLLTSGDFFIGSLCWKLEPLKVVVISHGVMLHVLQVSILPIFYVLLWG